MAVLRTSGQDTARMFPTSISLRCSVSPVALLISKMAIAEATEYAIPMNASCGMWPRRVRASAKIPAPKKVNPRLIQYEARPWGSMPTTIATVAPSAAICASAKSTKITPRSTTCTPRYAWMPVRIRLATNGASKNKKISIELLSWLVSGGVKRLFQLGNVVVEKFEIVGDLFLSTDRRRQHEHLRSRFPRHRLRRFQVEIRLHDNHLHAVAFHLLNKLHRVLRAWRNCRPRLDVANHVQVEVRRRIMPRAAVR